MTQPAPHSNVAQGSRRGALSVMSFRALLGAPHWSRAHLLHDAQQTHSVRNSFGDRPKWGRKSTRTDKLKKYEKQRNVRLKQNRGLIEQSKQHVQEARMRSSSSWSRSRAHNLAVVLTRHAQPTACTILRGGAAARLSPRKPNAFRPARLQGPRRPAGNFLGSIGSPGKYGVTMPRALARVGWRGRNTPAGCTGNLLRIATEVTLSPDRPSKCTHGCVFHAA